MLKLYCLPLGETKRDDFIADYQNSVFLLPSSFLLNTVREKMRAYSSSGHEQLKLLSFDELVAYILQLAGMERERINRLTQEILIGKILVKLAEREQLPYFSGIAEFPGYIRTMTDLLGEIKRSGATPEEFLEAAEAGGLSEKDREVAIIYAVYQQSLAELGLADLEEMYILATHALQEDKAKLPFQRLCVSEFYVLTPLQIEVMVQLSHTMDIEIALVYEKNRPRLYKAVEDTVNTLVGKGFSVQYEPLSRPVGAGAEHIKRHLFAQKPKVVDAGHTVTIINSPRRSKEIAEVANRIKILLQAGSYAPEDIAVVARDLAMYDDLRGAFAKVGVPINMPWEESAAGRPLIQFIANCFTAQLNQGERHTVKNLLKSPVTAACLALDADLLEYRLLTKVIHNWQDWTRVIQEITGSEEEGLIRDKFELLRKLVAGLPHSGTCSDFVQAVELLLTKLRISESMGDLYRQGVLSLPILKAELQTFQLVNNVLEELAQGFALLGQEEEVLTAADFLQLFRQATATVTVRLEQRDSSGVQVISPINVRGVRFPVVFIVGLTEGQFPRHQRENWLYNESERRLLVELGVNMVTDSLQRAQEDLYFAIAVAMADNLLILSCLEDPSSLPSSYVEEVSRLFASDTVPIVKFDVNEWFSATYDQIGSADMLTDKLLADYFGAEQVDVLPAGTTEYVWHYCLDKDFPRRLAANQLRTGSDFTVYDGVLDTLEARTCCCQLAKQRPAFSISTLEAYAKCPFAYFARYVLRLDGWNEQDEEVGNDVVGTIYHAVLAEFMQSHCDQLLDPAQTTVYQRQIGDLLQTICDRLANQGKLAYSDMWKYEQHRLLQALKRWLAFELQEQAAEGAVGKPHKLEWAFGPLQLTSSGDTVAITGKIDRIDICGDSYVVADYKRGSCPGFEELQAGTDMQIALYITAIEQLLCVDSGRQVAGGGYYSIEGCKKEGGMWQSELIGELSFRKGKRVGHLDSEAWVLLQKKISASAVAYARGIRSGHFPVRPGVPCPDYCPAKGLCRYDKYRMAGKLLEVGDNE